MRVAFQEINKLMAFPNFPVEPKTPILMIIIENPCVLRYISNWCLIFGLSPVTGFSIKMSRLKNEVQPNIETHREENKPDSLPVLTVGNVDRIRKERIYREKCAERIAEILLDLENHLGTERIFIP